MAEKDLRDTAAKAATLALALGAATPGAASLSADLGKKYPSIAPVLGTLKATRQHLAGVRARREELEALTQQCTYVTACVITRHQLSGASRQSDAADIDATSLLDCVEAIHRFVERRGRRGKLSRVLKASGDKSGIAELSRLVRELPRDMGLEGIVAVFKGVLVRLHLTVCKVGFDVHSLLPQAPVRYFVLY